MPVQELVLLCHGAATPDTGASDSARGLTSRGKRQAQKLGCWLQQQGFAPDIAMASPPRAPWSAPRRP